MQKGTSALPPIATANADSRKGHVCFTSESGMCSALALCLLSANSGHGAAISSANRAASGRQMRCRPCPTSSPALCGSGIFLRLMTARTISIDRSGRGRQQKRSGRLKSPIRYCNMGDLFIFVRYPTKQGRRRSGNRARMAKETCYGSEIRNVWQNHSNL